MPLREGRLEELDALRARIDAHRPFTPDVDERLRRWTQPRYIYCSNALGERDALTPAETAAFLEREICSGGHPLDKFLAVERHKLALELVERRAREGGVVDVAFVRDLHRTLEEGRRRPGLHPGEWKTQENERTRRRGRTFRYSPPDKVGTLMEQLVTELAAARSKQHPVLAVAAFYYHFHLVHPFDRDNGRVARLAATCALLNHGYPHLMLDPDDVGRYLDALTACDHTVPRELHAPLSPRIDTTPFADLVAEALTQTAREALDLLEGRRVQADDLPARVAEDQGQVLEYLMSREDVSWRVKAGYELRALHERLVRVVKKLACAGPLYRIDVEQSDVVPTHAAPRGFAAKLPAGDAGMVGLFTLTIAGDRTTGFLFPEPARLEVVLAGTRYGTQLLLLWSGGAPRVHHGPSRAEQWPDALLDKLVTEEVDRRRRAFEAQLIAANVSPGERMSTDSLLEKLTGRMLGTGAAAPRPTPEATTSTAPTVEDDEDAGAGEGAAPLEGISPSEPPVTF